MIFVEVFQARDALTGELAAFGVENTMLHVCFNTGSHFLGCQRKKH